MERTFNVEGAALASDTVSEVSPQLTWQQTKSKLTRSAILQAAVDCFYTLGYANTTTENIAQRANVSRGAMLHHFPSRFDLISATVLHLNTMRLEMFAAEEIAVQRDAEYSRVEEGIDIYWRQLNTPAFVVFHELEVASRTDTELAQVVHPAMAEFETAWYDVVRDIFPDLALSEAFVRANYMTKYLLEGMAIARVGGVQTVPETMMLDWLKRELRRSFQDVLGSVKRPNTD